MKGFDLDEDVRPAVEPDLITMQKRSDLATKQSSELSDNITTSQKLGNAVADNFGRILDLAGSLVEIKKMKAVSDAYIAKIEEDRKMLLTEAESYVLKKNADTKTVVDKMNVIRFMMQDFYQQSKAQISSEDFRQIITSIVDQMGRVSDEQH